VLLKDLLRDAKGERDEAQAGEGVHFKLKHSGGFSTIWGPAPTICLTPDFGLRRAVNWASLQQVRFVYPSADPVLGI